MDSMHSQYIAIILRITKQNMNKYHFVDHKLAQNTPSKKAMGHQDKYFTKYDKTGV